MPNPRHLILPAVFAALMLAACGGTPRPVEVIAAAPTTAVNSTTTTLTPLNAEDAAGLAAIAAADQAVNNAPEPTTTTVTPTTAPKPKPPTKTVPPTAPKPQVTVSQENALRSAQDYLSVLAFSRRGLIEQLSSQYGDGYSLADATWAVSTVEALHAVDWNQEAVQSARDYLNMMGFSRQGLIQQLSSPYGDQYTVAQATFAANAVGLK